MTRAIISLTLPPGVKFDITSVMLKLLNIKGVFVCLAMVDVNIHHAKFIGI